MKFVVFSLVILFAFCSQASNLRQTLSRELSVKAINDILQAWYENDKSSDPCMNGTHKIIINDTLKWRSYSYADDMKAEEFLEKYHVNKDVTLIASQLSNFTEDVDFVKKRILFKPVLHNEPTCSEFYFSPLYATNVKDYYIVQYILNSFGLIQESLLLLKFDGKHFTTADQLLLKVVWF